MDVFALANAQVAATRLVRASHELGVELAYSEIDKTGEAMARVRRQSREARKLLDEIDAAISASAQEIVRKQLAASVAGGK